MPQIRLGRTGLMIEKNGFGCLPIQRLSAQAAGELLLRAVEGGMTFFDTARMYTDSEEKMGRVFHNIRDRLILATKTHAKTGQEAMAHLEQSLRDLRTDHVDLYQLHNPAVCHRPGDEHGVYDALLRAKEQGKILHIGITNHRLAVAKEAIASGLYETLQFPYSYLAGPQEQGLVDLCAAQNMGFIAMKGLAGGLIQNGRAAFAYMAQQDTVVPIWGIQHGWELEEFLTCMAQGATLTTTEQAVIDRDRQQLQGDFCRGCGYCLPCPVGIEINMAARMSLMIRRMVEADQLTPAMQEMMHKVKDCVHCGQCAKRCPYGLDTPKLLEENYKDYLTFLPKA